LQKGSDHTRGFAGRSAAEKADHWHRRLLRARRKRPRSRAAEQRDELAPPHAEHGASSPPGGIPSPSHLMPAVTLGRNVYPH